VRGREVVDENGARGRLQRALSEGMLALTPSPPRQADPPPSETTDATAARQRSSLYSRSVQRHISRAARSGARSGFLRNRNALSLSLSLSLSDSLPRSLWPSGCWARRVAEVQGRDPVDENTPGLINASSR